MKNSNDAFGNRTRDLSACSTVPQPTVSPRAQNFAVYLTLTIRFLYMSIKWMVSTLADMSLKHICGFLSNMN